MFTKIIYTIVITIVIFLFAGFFLPSTVHVERSIAIERPVFTVFTLLNGYHSHPAWSPWPSKDPFATRELSGPRSGPGARISWDGDPRMVGRGWQQIVASEPPSLVRSELSIDQLGDATTWFLLDAVDGSTRVTWRFETDLVAGQGFFGGILARYFGLLFDRWIGGDFEAGLAALKSYAESLPEIDFSDLDVSIVQAEPMEILYVAVQSGRGAADISASLASAYREITGFMADNGIARSAQPMAITRARAEGGYEFDAAIPVENRAAELSGNVRAGLSPSGLAVRVVHTGPYDRMAPSYEKLAAYMSTHGFKEGEVSWEHYISDPGETESDRIVTHIYFLIAEPDQQGEP